MCRTAWRGKQQSKILALTFFTLLFELGALGFGVHECDACGPHDFKGLASNWGKMRAIGQKSGGHIAAPKMTRHADAPQLGQGPVTARCPIYFCH